MKKLIKFSLAAALAASFANAAVYEIDPAHSSVGFKIKHLSISKVSGNFGKFDAVIGKYAKREARRAPAKHGFFQRG